jgi:hypothetical protein
MSKLIHKGEFNCCPLDYLHPKIKKNETRLSLFRTEDGRCFGTFKSNTALAKNKKENEVNVFLLNERNSEAIYEIRQERLCFGIAENSTKEYPLNSNHKVRENSDEDEDGF